jgi:ATP-binding cassette subfamily C protein CydD
MIVIDNRLLREGKKHVGLLFLLVVLGVAAGCLIVLQANYMVHIIEGAFRKGRGLAELRADFAYLLLVMAGRSVVVWCTETTAQRLSSAVKTGLRNRLVEHLLGLGPAFVLEEEAGELVNLLTEGMDSLEPYFAKFLPQLSAAVIVPIMVIITVVSMDWETAILFLITAPLIPVFMMLIGHMAQKRNQRQWETLSRLSAHFLDVIQGLPTLKILGRSKEQARVIARLSGQFRETTLDVLRIAFLSALVLELTATMSTALVAVTVGLRLLYMKMTFHQAFFLLLLAPEFYLPLRQLGTQYHAALSGVAAAQRIFRIFARQVPENETEGCKLKSANGVRIEFDDVCFAYHEGRREALKNFSCCIRAGELIALVGASGCGKSTVAALLAGFIRPDQGEIRIEGVPMLSVDQADWLRHVAVVPQSPHIFSRTVFDNIRMGKEAGREAVIAAAKAAGADEFIRKMPQGYDTYIGEGGYGLSGGEAKRLAISRAFLQDASLIILDEATAGLDVYRERAIEEALARLIEKKTVIVIAHRLTTVKKAQRILVMDDGEVVEAGTHAELTARNGRYSKLLTAFREGS